MARNEPKPPWEAITEKCAPGFKALREACAAAPAMNRLAAVSKELSDEGEKWGISTADLNISLYIQAASLAEKLAWAKAAVSDALAHIQTASATKITEELFRLAIKEKRDELLRESGATEKWTALIAQAKEALAGSPDLKTAIERAKALADQSLDFRLTFYPGNQATMPRGENVLILTQEGGEYHQHFVEREDFDRRTLVEAPFQARASIHEPCDGRILGLPKWNVVKGEVKDIWLTFAPIFERKGVLQQVNEMDV